MAVTEYSLTRSWPKFALLDVRIFTGRTHQIRVHLAHLHHPVAGDARYGGWKRALESAPSDAVRLALEALEGQALHAARVAFEHPISGVPLIIDAPLPPELERVLRALDAA
jgi:23S rRNA pseudouridine1911/1915/1917 synthase